jgi:hypothetical protein
MFRNLVALCAAASLAGCSINPKEQAGLTDAISGIFTTVNTYTALDQTLAEEFLRHSAELEFISRRFASCRDNDDPIIKELGVVQPKSIQKRESDLLQLRLAELYLIKKYGDAILAYSQQAADRSRHVDEIVHIGEAISGSAFAPPEAKVAAAAAKTFAGALKAIDQHYTNEQIKQAAITMHQPLVKMVGALKRNFHVVPQRTQLYLNAWRNCAEEKFRYMRDRPDVASPVVDLTGAYGVFQAQYRTYINAMPPIGNALDNIVKANAALMTTSSDEVALTAKSLSDTVNAVVATYNTAKTLPQEFKN